MAITPADVDAVKEKSEGADAENAPPAVNTTAIQAAVDASPLDIKTTEIPTNH